MIIFIVLILVLLLLWALAGQRRLKTEMNSLAKQMAEISNSDTNRQLMVGTQQGCVGNLATEINRLYEQMELRQADQIATMTEIRQSIANISHDLRTPLTAIIGYLELMGQQATSEEQRKRYLLVALNKSESLNDLVNAFFEYTRLEARVYQFVLEKTDTKELLIERISLYYDEFAQKNQQPVLELGSIPLYQMADTEALSRIYDNLLQNSLRHGEGDLHITAVQQADRIKVIFSNRVSHLNVDEPNRLFDRFVVANNTRTGQSTGLGLSIVREFVEQMNGSITAEYNKNRLSFVISWPAL